MKQNILNTNNIQFSVPEGLDEHGNLVPVEQAVKGQAYYCPAPQCRAKLTLRKGKKLLKSGRLKATHFAHLPGTNCSPDRVTHGLAQHRVVEAVRNWKRGTGEAPCVRYTCADCWQPQSWPLPEAIIDGKLEHTITHEGKYYRLDVALLPFDAPKLAVEVYQTHYTEEGKEADLFAAGITHFEVDAKQILDNPTQWCLIKPHPDFTTCPACKRKALELEQRKKAEAEQKEAFLKAQQEQEAKRRAEEEERARLTKEQKKPVSANTARVRDEIEEFLSGKKPTPSFQIDVTSQYREEAFALALKLGVHIPRTYYRYMIVRCWSCRQKILVYTWPGKQKWDPRKPYFNGQPIPATLVEVTNKKTKRQYWANTCKLCGKVQGDDYLVYPVDPQENTQVAFQEDLKIIARNHYR